MNALANATEAQSERAIVTLKRAIEAAENSNQAGENFVVIAAAGHEAVKLIRELLDTSSAWRAGGHEVRKRAEAFLASIGMVGKAYRGWNVHYDNPPIPLRSMDWSATSPDYDVDCEDGVFVVCAGQQVHAETYEGIVAEIDAHIAESAA